MQGLKNRAGNKSSPPGKAVFFMLLSVLLLSVCLYCTGKIVFLVEGGGESQQYFTFSRTVGEFINEAAVRLRPPDRLQPAPTEPLKHGDTVFIRRAVPVIIAVDGGEQEVWTQSRSVLELLREKRIDIGAADRVAPGFNHVLQPGDRVEVIRASVEYVHRREPVPFDTLRLNNTALDQGIVRVKQEGTDGEKELVIAVVKGEDGIVSRTVLYETVLREPVPRVLEYGENRVFARGGRTFEFSRAISVEATAYCPGTPQSGCPLDKQGHACCTGAFNDGYTSTGAKALAGDGSWENPHIIAVDPAVIPLYSLVCLEEYGFARALDRGGAIRGHRIDLLFDRHEDALKFGRRQLKVYILPH